MMLIQVEMLQKMAYAVATGLYPSMGCRYGYCTRTHKIPIAEKSLRSLIRREKVKGRYECASHDKLKYTKRS